MMMLVMASRSDYSMSAGISLGLHIEPFWSPLRLTCQKCASGALTACSLCSKIVLICYAAIPSMKLNHAQVIFYYADTMLTRADHATYHVWNVAMEWLPTIKIEVCSSFEPETELGVATSATVPSLLDRLRCLLSLSYQITCIPFQAFVFNEFSASKMPALCAHTQFVMWSITCKYMCAHRARDGHIYSKKKASKLQVKSRD